MMKNFFAIVILLFLAVASFVSSAPQKKPSTSSPKTLTQDDLNGVAGIIKSLNQEGFNKTTSDSDLGSLSPECQNALFIIITSPEFQKCIPVPAFLPLLPILTDPNTLINFIKDPIKELVTIQQPLVQFSDAFCPAPKCSDEGVTKALATLQEGCKADLDKQIVQLIIVSTIFYSPVRDTICFKDDKSKFCFFEDDIDYLANLKPSPIVMVGGILDEIAASPVDVCTRCNKAIFNTGFNYISQDSVLGKAAKEILALAKIDDKVLDAVKFGAALKCGVGFEDGKVEDPSQPPPKSP